MIGSYALTKKIQNSNTYTQKEKDFTMFVSNFLLNVNDFLDKFYKNENKKSIQIVVDERIKEMCNSAISEKNIKLASNLLQDKVKSSYLNSNNKNFMCIAPDYSGFYALSRSEAERILVTFNLNIFNYISNSIKKLCINKDVENIYNEIKGSTVYNSKIEKMTSKVSNSFVGIAREILYINPSKISKESVYSDLLEFIKCNLSNDARKSGIEILERVSSLMSVELAEKKLSNIFNSTFDFISNIENKLKICSKIEQYTHVNAVSGFQSIKNKREYLDNSEISEDDFKKYISSYQDANKFFEYVSEYIAVKSVKPSDDKIKIISGNDIMSYYVESSYKRNEALKNPSMISGGLLTNETFNRGNAGIAYGGSLFNSCMRGASSMPRIKWYAENSQFVRMIIYRDDLKSKKISARAIIWYDEKNDINYVDRIYYANKDAYTAIISHIDSNKNFYSIHRSGSSSKYLSKFKIPIKRYDYCGEVPYLDSVRYFHIDKKTNEIFIMGEEDTSGNYICEHFMELKPENIQNWMYVKNASKNNESVIEIPERSKGVKVTLPSGRSILSSRENIYATKDGNIICKSVENANLYLVKGDDTSFISRAISDNENEYRYTEKKYCSEYKTNGGRFYDFLLNSTKGKFCYEPDPSASDKSRLYGSKRFNSIFYIKENCTMLEVDGIKIPVGKERSKELLIDKRISPAERPPRNITMIESILLLYVGSGKFDAEKVSKFVPTSYGYSGADIKSFMDRTIKYDNSFEIEDLYINSDLELVCRLRTKNDALWVSASVVLDCSDVEIPQFKFVKNEEQETTDKSA